MKLFLILACLIWLQPVCAQTETIRGTWVTNVGSDALLSKKNIRKAVRLCKEKGINTLFVVVWNDGVTMYPSAVVESYTGVRQDPVYKKGFDPLKTIIREGHRQGLKVHAWFEFGFSYAYKNDSSRWVRQYPGWAGRDASGQVLKKNGFYWWNALHPEVQSFMRKLVLEVVTRYDIDGVQGDDRLPAMPAEGGYDDYTKALYKKETKREVPADHNEPHWLQWKADQLSAFGKSIYNEIKNKKPGCKVSWAPSVYPWSKEQYLQDWPAWMTGGYADYILPQVYRYDITGYEKTLQQLSAQLTPEQKKKVFPGILTSLADGYLVKKEMLEQMIRLNRQYGFDGECLFYFECLRKLDTVY